MLILEIIKSIKENNLELLLFESKNEVINFIRDRKKGTSYSIEIDFDEAELLISKKSILKIFKSYLMDRIKEWDLEYIFKVIEVKGNFSNERCFEVVNFISNSDYIINKDNIEKMILYLKSDKDLFKNIKFNKIKFNYGSILV